MMIPGKIRDKLPEGEYQLDQIGCSGAKVMIFDDRVLKIEKDCNAAANEANMLQWLHGRFPVPRVIETAYEDDCRYLLMSRIPGKYMCDDSMLDDQDLLAEMIAGTLEKMWAVDISTCPADRSLKTKLAEIEEGLRAGTVTMDIARQEETYGPGGFASAAQLFEWLVKYQPEEKLVLSHGDFCLPNIFSSNGKLSGIIDLGYAGVADPWVDIEKVTWSMWANTTGLFGGKKRDFKRDKLFKALHIQPDEDKLRYYSLLSELC